MTVWMILIIFRTLIIVMITYMKVIRVDNHLYEDTSCRSDHRGPNQRKNLSAACFLLAAPVGFLVMVMVIAIAFFFVIAIAIVIVFWKVKKISPWLGLAGSLDSCK